MTQVQTSNEGLHQQIGSLRKLCRPYGSLNGYLELEETIYTCTDEVSMYDDGELIYKFVKKPAVGSVILYDRVRDKDRIMTCRFHTDHNKIIDLSGPLTQWNCCWGIDKPTASEQWCQLQFSDYTVHFAYDLSSQTLRPTKVIQD